MRLRRLAPLLLNFYGNIYLAIPADVEQRKIVEFIKCESVIINNAIQKIEKELTLLQEYKTTLIAEAVTGKIDVREWRPKEFSSDVPG